MTRLPHLATRLPHLGRPRASSAPDDATKPAPPAGEGGGDAEAGAGTDDRSATDAQAAPGPPAPDEAPAKPRRSLRHLVPATCAALLVLAGSGFFYGAHQLRSTPSARNHALTDAEATTRVAGDVGNALARVFSYAPDGLGTTERAARTVLAGRAERQYADLMGRVRADLAAQRVTLSTQAVRTGVIELDGDTARLLVFLDQISHRGKAGTSTAAAQLTVTARRENDQWRVVDIRTR
ncbi:nuclear transport factor 2 family protein [Streptomyces sp. G44]|uniref:nuclear transport factor 2 family protein n=1 Tax=Streptomyces sp. G44 TaxID=2807632 RepID=UPI0019615890|nr:nuclear transport factor 2 family protein [Streptomyces sp. G44]MBM7170050.1 nuclear transport factor 2 family protein [Streptomyces sp. G44]